MPNPNETFAQRHIGPRPEEIATMLKVVGASTLDELIDETVPSAIRDETLGLPTPLSEVEVVERLRALAAKNRVVPSLIGLGYHDTITPPVIQRNVLENPAWYTAYTPYQAEISQGRLEALLNFQTMVADMTGLDIANSSLLDEPTAAAEAMAMCRRMTPGHRDVFYVDPECHSPTIAVVRTRANAIGVEVEVFDETSDPARSFGILLQYPGTSGVIAEHAATVERFKEAGAHVAVATDLLALSLLDPPGEWGADIAVGSAQRFGVPMGYGGPHAGFIATTEKLVRNLPGRLVGVSVDRAGDKAYRLALQTREQHIRREKATSNVCTAQVLLAVMAGLYACWHGADGIRAIASEVHRLANQFAAGAMSAGFDLLNTTWFDTVSISVPRRAEVIRDAALKRRC